MTRLLKDLWLDEDGLTTVEYALLLLLIVFTGMTAWITLGARLSETVASANENFPGNE